MASRAEAFADKWMKFIPFFESLHFGFEVPNVARVPEVAYPVLQGVLVSLPDELEKSIREEDVDREVALDFLRAHHLFRKAVPGIAKCGDVEFSRLVKFLHFFLVCILDD